MMQKSQRSADLTQILKSHFGFPKFRLEQERVIQHVMDGKDALVLFPTGGGKSICYQLPAIIFPGLTLVISPLIALMHDQVESLRAKGIEADLLTSQLSADEIQLAEARVIAGETKLLYVSPEKLLSQNFYDILRVVKLSLIAIDEAHCISEWGSDFRPEYAKMAFLKTYFPEVPILALTATADIQTQKLILDKLSIPNAQIFRTSFKRENIAISICNAEWKQDQLLYFLAGRMHKNGVIYCRSRQSVNALHQQLHNYGFSVAKFHRNLSQKEKIKTLQDFIKGEVRIVVATIAFGMGIDKSDIDFVVHMNIPRSLEQYYQEIGRAGRDGREAEAVGFFSKKEKERFTALIEEEGQNEFGVRKLESSWRAFNSTACMQQLMCSQFGEYEAEQCGKCVKCTSYQNPIATQVAIQKALSALYRFGKSAQTHDVISLLIGKPTELIQTKELDQTPTFGCGTEFNKDQWEEIVHHGIASGAFDVYHDTLIWNENSSNFLQQSEGSVFPSTQLYSYIPEEISEQLSLIKYWRNQVAKQNACSPEEVMHDGMIHRAIQGSVSSEFVHQHLRKFRNYQKLEQVLFQKPNKKTFVKKKTINSLQKTLEWFELGLSISEIADVRGIQELTIYSHLSELVVRRKVKWNKVIGPSELKEVKGLVKQFGDTSSLTHFVENSSLSAGKIRVALQVIEHNLE